MKTWHNQRRPLGPSLRDMFLVELVIVLSMSASLKKNMHFILTCLNSLDQFVAFHDFIIIIISIFYILFFFNIRKTQDGIKGKWTFLLAT